MVKEGNKGFIKSGIFSFGQRFSGILFGFGTFFFLVRVYPKSTFGAWALFMAITAVIEVARNGLIRNANIRFINYEESHASEINTASLFLNVMFSLTACLVLYFVAPLFADLWNIPEMIQMLRYYNLTILVMTFNSQFEYLLFAHKDFKGAFAGTAIRFGVLFLFVLTAFFLTFTPALTDLILVQAFAAFISSCVLFLFARKHFRFSRKLSKKWILDLLGFGKYTFGTNISSMLNRYIDQAMVGAMIAPAAVAGYNAAIRVSTLIEAPTLAIASVVFPETAKKIKTGGKEAVKDVYEKSVGAILAITLPGLIFALIFPEFIILLIAGKEYLDAATILQVTILYSLFIPFARQFGTIFDSIGKPKLNFMFVVGNAVLNGIFNYIFIKSYGINGAAYGSLTAYALIFCGHQYVLNKQLGVSTLSTFKNMIVVYQKLFTTTRVLLAKQFQ